MVLYNSQLANEDETRGRKRALSAMISFILNLVQLRRNFDVKHLMYLFKTSEGTVINTILTWINYMYISLGHYAFALCFPSEKKYVQLHEGKISKCQMHYRMCWIQSSSTFISAITQVDVIWLQKPNYRKSTCWDCIRWTI